ncbi:hypothetical protein GCM10025331_32340 [Actinoplanes utahensis]|uniref:Uncharacterized protein n=1 Tax=Actinoplanes utahensis TaxID=1869 RepID=A0A0A6XEB9_ACTUT|nr:hypothetical protein MB27_04200 [Actinoplanes utahensis]GIF31919.1 hypothetical protein Aut01nite_49050 [Actinoplanes utahensis]
MLNAPEVASAPKARRPIAGVLLRLLPWIFPAAVAFGVLHAFETPDRQIALYAAYFLLAVVVPGTLVFRGLYGSRGNWPEDLGLGAATGLVVLLLGWALGAATGLQDWLPAWPALIAVLFLAVPRLRRHWLISEPAPLPVAWSWAVAAVLVMVALWGITAFEGTELPPDTAVIYQDLYYHLALVHEMTRTMPFEVPQVAGDALRYHFLSDADMAAASMITGIPAANVLLRLWVLPIAAVAVVVFAALGRSAAGRWWVGALAAALGFVGYALTLGGPITPMLGGVPLTFLSPSQVYALPLIGLFTLLATEALRGRPLRGAWALLPLLALACAGAKSSVLPPLAAGVGLAGVVLLWRRRRIPWTAVGLLGAIVFGIVLGFRLFAGGGAGTLLIQPLQALHWMAPYAQTLGAGEGTAEKGFLVPGLAGADAAGWAFVVGLLAWWALMQAPRLVGLLVWPHRREETAGTVDPVRWLFGGIVVAGAGGLWAFAHPSLSQGYFYTGVLPMAAVLTAWTFADRIRTWLVPVLGGVAGAAWQVLAPEVKAPAEPSVADWAWALAVPVLTTAAVVVVPAVIGVAIWRKRALRALPVLLLAAIVGGGLANGVVQTAKRITDAPPKSSAASPSAVTEQEMRAALWLEENAGEEDLVATNVHCTPIKARENCNARAFWVAGLGGRRTLVESWGYADQSVAANGRNGLYYANQPAPYPEVFALNERVFRTGAAADVAELRDRFGVRWLFADSRAGAVSPALAQVADVRHTQGTVTIYELRPA